MAHPSAILSVLVNADTAAATANLTKYDRQLQAVNDSARNGIETRLGATVDSKGFDEYQAKLAKTAQMAKDRAAFKAELGANFNPAAFQAYQRAVDAARRQAARAVNVQVSIKAAVARLNELQVRMGKVPDKISIKADVDTGVAETKLNILQAKIRETERQAAAGDLGLGGAGGGFGGFGSRLVAGFSGGVPGLGPLALGAGAAPLVAGGLGAATAVVGSAAAAAAGAGAVGTGAAGIGAAGIGPLLVLSGGLKDAIKLSTQLTTAQDNLAAAQKMYGGQNKQLTTAQNNYNAAVAAFGPTSNAAVSAHGQLLLAQKKQVAVAPQIISAQNAIQKLLLTSDPAVVKFAKSWSTFTEVIDNAEQAVLPAFARTLTPVIAAVTKLMPTIVQMAKIDLSGISKGLAPLLQFLQGSTFKTALLDLSHAFAQLAPTVIGASLNLLKAFLAIATAAAPYVIEIAKAFERWTASFAKSVAPGAKLQGLIAYLVGQLHSWWDLAVAIGKLMFDIFKSGATVGQGLVDKLTLIVDKWDRWINSKTGQEDMKKFFTDSARLIGAVASTLAPVVRLISSMAVGLIPTMTTLLRPLATILARISQWVNDLSKGLPPVLNALPGLAVAVGVLAGWKALQAVVAATATSILSVAKSKLPGGAAAAAGGARAGGGAVAGAEGAGAAAAAGGGISLLGAVAIPVGLTAGLVALSRAIHGDGGVNADLKLMQTRLKDAIAAGDVGKIHTLTDTIGAFGKKLSDDGIKGADQFKKLADAGNTAADRITKSFGTLSTKLTQIAPIFKVMAGDAGQSLHTIQVQAAASASAIASTLGTKSNAARVAIATNFSIAASDIRASMQAGVINTGQGMKAIADMLKKALSALGGKPLAVSNFLADVGPGVVTAQQLVASGNLSPGGVASPHAVGGLIQIGQAGQKGRDAIPLSVGGTNIVVGAGEQVAVFNHDQQKVMNARLADMGGLPGMFSKHNRPHYMASGGMVPGLDSQQNQVLGALVGIGRQRHMPAIDILAAVETGLVEQNLHNQAYGDGTSVGWRQETASSYGAAVGPRMDLTRTINQFYNEISGVGSGSAGQRAQAVQRSAYPDRYDAMASRALALIAAAGGGGLAGLGGSHIGAPSVKGGGAVTGVVRAVLSKATAAANALLSRRSAAAAAAAVGVGGVGGGGGGAQGPGGLGTFDGLQVANWIIPELMYAQAHGWRGRITSGYRPGFDPHAPSGSEHALTRYPGGAVDFGGMVDPAGAANRAAFMAATADYKGLRLIPATGFRDDGHMSGTGHAKGGLVAHAKGGMIAAATGLHTAALAKAKTKPPRAASHPPHHAATRHPKPSKVHVPAAINDALKRLLPADVVNIDTIGGNYAGQQTKLAAAFDQLTYTQGLPPFPAQPLVTLTDADVAAMDPTGALGYQVGDEIVNPSGMKVGRFFGPNGIQGGSFVPGISQRQAQISKLLSNLYGQRAALGQAKKYYGRAVHLDDAAKKQRQQRYDRVLAFLRKQVVKAKVVQAEIKAISTGNLKQNIARALSKQAIGRRITDLTEQKTDVSQELAAERASQAKLPNLARDPTHTNALRAQLSQVDDSLRVERTLSSSGAGSIAVEAAKSKLLKSTLTNRLAALATVDRNLGGRPYDIGTGGLLGQLRSQMDAIDANKVTEQSNKDGLAPVMQTVANSISSYLYEQAQLPGTTAIQVRTPTVAAAAAAAAVNPADALLQQLLTQSRQTTAVSEAQFATLKQWQATMPPFGGSFATGGVVPGPAGSPRTIIAHGGETVSNGAPVVHVNFANGMEWLKQFVDVRVEQGTRGQARLASRKLPGSR